MPRRRANKSPPRERKSEDGDDDEYFFDDCQSNSSKNGQEPQHRNAANARERARMRVLSKAFCRLKTTLPWVPADTKLSKLDTLRLAASYIAHLRALLNDEPRSSQIFPHPLNLAWPFAFQHGGSVGCMSPRWSFPQPDDTQEGRTADCTRYPQRSYREFDCHVDSEKRYTEASVSEACDQTVQYSSYDYRDNCYGELRNENY